MAANDSVSATSKMWVLPKWNGDWLTFEISLNANANITKPIADALFAFDARRSRLLGEKATLIFEAGFSIVLVVRGEVDPAFAISPRRIGLSPDGKPKNITIKSNLKVDGFSVKSLNADVHLESIKHKDNTAIVSCAIKASQQDSVPFELSVPIVISYKGGQHRYVLQVVLQVLNSDAVYVATKTAIASMHDDCYHARIVLKAHNIESADIPCDHASVLLTRFLHGFVPKLSSI
ncbi:MAG: hypothetical protein AB8B91_03160 [Rubripirellula sp.]